MRCWSPLLITAAFGLAAPLAAQNGDGLEWNIRGDDESMTLAFELPDTDAVHLGMTCDRGSGRITLWRIPPADARPEFRLSSGPIDATYSGTLRTDELPYLSTIVSSQDRVLKRFLATGELALTADGAVERMNATQPQRDRIARFFQHCG
ncbi:hypothetical protein RCO27_14075 [Sphingosinicella sp. LHD-64]|uniref:hypothetical protein n=1 Tax=Sphingosinicella sp. LHD-64 TaxID=3072139 RepID=UPI00280E514F|nr:hypothetical protein [Sphingosinicella sp. LHD-64]MDQ8757354.1 hypothetical protein [Sphingosinicella sp. LHD-64]